MEANVKLHHAEIYFPDEAQKEFSKCTHLAVGAHQDDIEIMATHGVLACLNSTDNFFVGVTCCDGGGSARNGEYTHYSDDEMKKIRLAEQNSAAKIGEYLCQIQLQYKSKEIKEQPAHLLYDLETILLKTRPAIIYTHNILDKHDTHVAVVTALVKTLRKISKEYRPEKIFGCEVWRGLDFFDHQLRRPLMIDCDEHYLLKLLAPYKSQIAGGKRYDLATIGRMRANATYDESHAVDQAEFVWYALDLLPLLQCGQEIPVYKEEILKEFIASIK